MPNIPNPVVTAQKNAGGSILTAMSSEHFKHFVTMLQQSDK